MTSMTNDYFDIEADEFEAYERLISNRIKQRYELFISLMLCIKNSKPSNELEENELFNTSLNQIKKEVLSSSRVVKLLQESNWEKNLNQMNKVAKPDLGLVKRRRNNKLLSCFGQEKLQIHIGHVKYLKEEEIIRNDLVNKIKQNIAASLQTSTSLIKLDKPNIKSSPCKGNKFYLIKEENKEKEINNKDKSASGINQSTLNKKLDIFMRNGFMKNVPLFKNILNEYKVKEHILSNITFNIDNQIKRLYFSKRKAKQKPKSKSKLMFNNLPFHIKNLGINKEMITTIERRNNQVLYKINRNLLQAKDKK